MVYLRGSRRPVAVLLLLLAALFLFTGCKVEYPDAVADNGALSSAVSDAGAAGDASSDALAESSAAPEGQSAPPVASQNTASSEAPSSQAGSGASPGGQGSVSAASGGAQSAPSSSAAPQNPQPVEPEDAKVDTNQKLTCTLSITCKTILQNMERLNKDKLSVLPADGVIYRERTVTFSAGESAFDVLLRETRKNRIHMEFENFPVFNSHYVEGIQNLYEFDCGEGSGWMYKVNGWFPNYGCSRYQLQNGDRVEWVYTCDQGHDIGGSFEPGRN